MRLADIVGQPAAVTVLRRALAAARVAHAYLFDGPEGTGKRSTALALGLALVCPVESGTGCGRCDTCRRALAGLHPDVRIVTPEGAWIVVDEIRPIVALAATRPHEAAARLVIIDPADKMNPAAANCLLKTLEEPAAGTHLVLCSGAPERLLPTIRSRTQRVRFRRVPTSDMVSALVFRGVPAERAPAIAALSDGSFSRASELTGDDGADAAIADVLALLSAVQSRSVAGIFEAAGTMGDKESKQDLPAKLSLLARMVRDASCSAAGAGELVVLRDHAPALATLARLGLPALGRLAAAVAEAEGALAGNANATLTLERLMLTMRREELR